MLSVRNDISEEEMQEIAGRISVEGGELVMTVAEKMQEEAELRRARKTAGNLLVMGDSVAKIAMVTELEEKEIEDIKKDINK